MSERVNETSNSIRRVAGIASCILPTLTYTRGDNIQNDPLLPIPLPRGSRPTLRTPHTLMVRL